MTTTQKDIAQALDHAAKRAETVGAAPATSKQCWFLAKLILETGKDAQDIGCGWSNTSAILTKRDASRYIDDYLRDAKVAA